VEIATDAAFTNVVVSHETTDTAWTVDSGSSLDSSARYWWRVTARNPCGSSGSMGPEGDTIFIDGFDAATSEVAGQEFTTVVLAGGCPVDTSAAVVFSDDMESGAGSWTHGATGGSTDTWVLGTDANSGTHAWQANAPVVGSPNAQWLVSPVVAIPSNLTDLTLKFWNQQDIKSGGANACSDGALVEVSADGGSTWVQLTGGLLTDPYDGTVSTAFDNPLSGKLAWCGDPQAYLNSIIDVQSYAGRSVQFRFN